MARFVGIDWDHNNLYLISGMTRRKQVRIEKGLLVPEPHTLDPAAAQETGKRLRQRLKAARIAPGPVIGCVGRERVIFKKLRYPIVEDEQEPALVRIQAGKELAEPAQRVLMDYTRLHDGNGNGHTRQAVVSAIRREWHQSLENLCKGAGLQLACLTPRPFGIAACLEPLGGAAPELAAPAPVPGASVGVLAVSQSWAEFSIVRDGEVLLSRALPLGDQLLEDVRRNLALYANQGQSLAARDTVQAIYFVGSDDHAALLEQLQQTLAVPVHVLDPFATEAHVQITGDRGGFAGLVGLARLWAGQEIPANFVSPKEPKTESGDKRRHLILTAGLVFALLLVGFVFGNIELEKRKQTLNAQKQELKRLEARIKQMKPHQEKLKLIQQWHHSALPWLEELYELTDRFPQQHGFKITQIDINPISASNEVDDVYTMRMKLTGLVPGNSKNLVLKLIDNINIDPCCRAKAGPQKIAGKSEDGKTVQQFVVEVDIAKEPVVSENKKGPALNRKPYNKPRL